MPGTLADVQGEVDARSVQLDRVGVTGLHYPLLISGRSGSQAVTAEIDLTVGLSEKQRGAHLSNLVETLHSRHLEPFQLDDLVDVLRDARRGQDERGLSHDRADLKVSFRYFLPKAAPASSHNALVPYSCGFEVSLNGASRKALYVRVPVATVCPCSLAISEVGAHNQRAELLVRVSQPVESTPTPELEDLIAIAERSASSQVHSLLKRADEKAVTEAMFRSPRFVEDVVREAVIGLRSAFRGVAFNVRCESFESIHPYNAYAETSGDA